MIEETPKGSSIEETLKGSLNERTFKRSSKQKTLKRSSKEKTSKGFFEETLKCSSHLTGAKLLQRETVWKLLTVQRIHFPVVFLQTVVLLAASRRPGTSREYSIDVDPPVLGRHEHPELDIWVREPDCCRVKEQRQVLVASDHGCAALVNVHGRDWEDLCACMILVAAACCWWNRGSIPGRIQLKKMISNGTSNRSRHNIQKFGLIA